MYSARNAQPLLPVSRYIRRCSEIQGELHRLLTQMAGFTLLLFTRDASASVCSGPIELVEKQMGYATDLLRSLRPPSEAAHHFYHLSASLEHIERAAALAGRCLTRQSGSSDRSELVQALTMASDNLRATTRLLPGFEMVDLSQACCAAHLTAEPMKFTATAV